MKFDVVVGNPPYQENDNGQREDGSTNASASPLYHLFEELAEKISAKQSLIFPARWLTGAGKGLGNFTKKMLNDKHIKFLELFQNSERVFPNTDIKGGVLFYTRDNEYLGETNIVVHSSNDIESYAGPLKDKNAKIFIPFKELANILDKVSDKTSNFDQQNIQKITSVLKPYGLRTDFFKNQKKYGLPEKLFANKEQAGENAITIFGLSQGNKREERYVSMDYPIPVTKTGENELSPNQDTINTYKVFVPKAYGAGALGEVIPTPILGKPILGKPIQIATETYLRIGNFQAEFEAQSLLKYIKTKFFRALVGILKTTQDSPNRVYRFVPLQDFTLNSDIVWNQSISEIDQQLYKKYNLNPDEIEFIETKVKEME
ncbi:MAG: Eco57I restriction-modification methylase domain-containing protein [Lactobacillaceae bacterium]|jgi:hypothetical protein|nr:Eco57I restriction-modification methylase domain-containing protein [Lactobacillaceae bacterium]